MLPPDDGSDTPTPSYSTVTIDLYSEDPSNTVSGNVNGYVYELCAEGASGCLKESDESLEAALADTYCKVIAGGGYATTQIFYYNYSALAIYIPGESLIDIAGYNLLGVRFEFENDIELSSIETTIYAENGDTAAAPDLNSAWRVYSGLPSISGNSLEFIFDAPYELYGANLILGFNFSISNWINNAKLYNRITLLHDGGGQ